MPRLPQPGGDNGNWGVILNDFLAQALKADGSIKDSVVTKSAIAPNAVDSTIIKDGSVTEANLDASLQIKVNAVAGTPDWSTITNKPAVIASGVDQAAARTSIGAGTSSLALAGTGSATTAAKSDHTQAAATISDSTAIGRAILTAVDAAAVKTSLSLTKNDVGLGNVDNTSDATKNSAAVTLTNKTLSNPKVNNLLDTNGNSVLYLAPIASAVNYVQVNNQSTGSAPALTAVGSDTNISLNLSAKGSGTVQVNGNQVLTKNMTLDYNTTLGGARLDWFYDINGYPLLTAIPVATPSNLINIGNAVSGSDPFIQGEGIDTNVGLNLTTKGTGKVKANGNPVIASTTAIPAVSGTPSSSNYLRGDGTWATPAGGGGGMLAPVRASTDGSETYTISSGSVTQINGTTIDGISPAVGDRILVTTAPASSGAGTLYGYTTQPANGIYTVTSNTTNLSLSRASDLSGAIHPAGLGVYVEEGAIWEKSGWWVVNPTSNGVFTYGTTAMLWTSLLGYNPHLGTAYFAAINLWQNGSYTAYLENNATATADQVLTLPATTTDTLVGRVSADTLSNKTLDSSNEAVLLDDNFTLQDDSDTTKQAKFQASGITTGTTRTYTLPDASGTLALTSSLPPIRFSAPTAVIGVSPTDYAYGSRTLTGARMRVASAPAGSALVAEVQHWDGFIWTTLTTLTIADGSVTDAVASFSQAQVAGNMVRINCTSVGATTAATGVAVDVTV